jgi:hypothetical protein
LAGHIPYIHGDSAREWLLWAGRGTFPGGNNLFEITGDWDFLS